MGKEGSMELKWIGAILIVSGCGGFGFSIVSSHKRQERLLRQLLRILKLMEWELRYRLTSLPELCQLAEKETEGKLCVIFRDFYRELSWQNAPDAASCMGAVLRRNHDLPSKLRRILRHLGSVLGRFDLEGQLQGLQSVQEEITLSLLDGGKEREQRLRSYQTLCLCAGCALAIILV